MPLRHQSIRAVFEASWNSLVKKERELLMGLSVFRDGVTLDAMARVTGIDPADAVAVTSGLARKSLLRSDPETGRFGMHPLLRQYTAERLSEHGLLDTALDTHKVYYLDLVRENERQLIGENMLACRGAMDGDFANIRQAWLRAVDIGDLRSLFRSAPGMYVYFDMHTRYQEGEALFRPAKVLVLEMSREKIDPYMALILLCWLDMAAQDDIPSRLVSEIRMLARQCLRSALKCGDNAGRAFSFLLMGAVAQRAQAHEQAFRFFRLALRAAPEIEREFWITVRMGLCRQAQGQTDRAVKHFRHGQTAASRYEDGIKMAWSLCQIGYSELETGDLERAQFRLKAAADAFGRIKAPIGMMTACEALGLAAFLKGDISEAESLIDQALAISKENGLARSRSRNARALKAFINAGSGIPERVEPLSAVDPPLFSGRMLSRIRSRMDPCTFDTVFKKISGTDFRHSPFIQDC